MVNETGILKQLKERLSARGKRNHELIGPYVTSLDSATGPKMKKLADKIPVDVRKRIARFKPFELYCLLACIDAEFSAKDKSHEQEKTGY